MYSRFPHVICWVIVCASVGVAATYPFVPSENKRHLIMTRNYELRLIPGIENKVFLPAMMTFYGATNEQEIISSDFTYSITPDSVTITADDLEIPRRYYCLTWKSPPDEPIQVQEKLQVNLLCRNKLYTQAMHPYDASVLQPFKDYLYDDPKGTIIVSDEDLIPICEDILKRNPVTAEELVECVCDWVNDNIEFGGGPRTSREVLQQRRGDCLGMALLATAIVRKLQIPADALVGRFLNSREGYYHGYMEVYFPDAGWVFYDLSNRQRGFKIPNSLLTAGRDYRIEVQGEPEPQWIKGYFSREQDFVKYKKPTKIPLISIRSTPTTTNVYGVRVIAQPVPESFHIRTRPLRDLVLDLEVPPGPRPYSR